MCVIYACYDKFPDDAELARGADRNTDGAGISWLAPDPEQGGKLSVFWEKGLKDDKAVKAFIKEKNLQLPMVIHFRTASIGRSCRALTHPFPTVQGAPLWESGSAPEVLFHNGTISCWDDLVLTAGLPSEERFPEGEWSDSRALAWLTYLKGPGVLDFVIKSSRVALMHSDANTEEDATYDKDTDHITLYGSGWIHHPGYSQSVSTGSSIVYVGKSYRGQYGTGATPADLNNTNVADDDEIMEGWPEYNTKASSPEVKTLTPATSNMSLNIWTLEELNSIISQLEEEQSSAKLAAGI
jgi:hypothetical protein